MNRFDRRTLLSFLAAAGTMTSLPPRRARSQDLDEVSVIVIGAGLSGIAAARTLADLGARVTVLEARAYPGGRLRTDWSLGPPFEVGAGWIHGPSPENPSKQLADAVEARYIVTDDDNLVVFDRNGDAISDDALDRINSRWDTLLGRLDANLETTDRRSLAQAVSAFEAGALGDPGMNWALSAYTEFSKGAPIEDLSAVLFDDDDAFDLPDVVVTTGYDKLLGPLMRDLDIRFATVASAVGYDVDDGVTVKTDKGTFDADYCVCSVPLGVLKAGKIRFDPRLPSDHLSRIDRVGFGSVTKIAFKFPEPFWDIETQYFGIMTEQKGRWNYWLNYRTFAPENILLGLSVGAYAPVADRMSDAEMAADALAVLRDVWEQAVGVPTQTLATHWSTDPFALGAYAYPRPGNSPADFDGLAEPIEGRLFLCGEHTIFDYAGTTHGAYLSGLRAAELVAEEAA